MPTYGINGDLSWVQEPYNPSPSSLIAVRQFAYRSANVHSVNEPIIFGIRWNYMNESVEPSPDNYVSPNGDIISVIFDVYQISDRSAGIFPQDWTLVASVRKTRDIKNISQRDKIYGGDGIATVAGHTFTVDISEICKDLLSYSLIPLGKGTWTDWRFGGLNGGAQQQDNLPQPVWSNNYIQTKNGATRRIRVQARTEIIDGDGVIREATNSGSYKNSYSDFSIINSAPDYDTNQIQSVNSDAICFSHGGWGTSNAWPNLFQSLCPNYTVQAGTTTGKLVVKDIGLQDSQEQVQWIQGSAYNAAIAYNDGYSSGTAPPGEGNPEDCYFCSTNTSDLSDDFFIRINAYDENWVLKRTARLYDWNSNLIPQEIINGYMAWPRTQQRMCSQNVSPVYINANCILDTSAVKDIWENGGTTYTRDAIDVGGLSGKAALFLNDDITYYSISGTMITIDDSSAAAETEKDNMFEYRWYKLDRERVTYSDDNAYMYAGVYYTELRSGDANPIRCKGLLWGAAPKQFFRIYWLNKAGGIDSYTVKGNHSIRYNNSKEIIMRPEPRRWNFGVGRSSTNNPYPSANASTTNGSYLSDTMRGADVHKGGKEVLSVDSTKSGTVTTLPLNEVKAEWLREIALSPSVWTEVQTQMQIGTNVVFEKIAYRSVSDITQGANTDGRTPNLLQYVPIIITNDSVDTYDTEKGLVTMTFEYTHAHSVVTQRN